MTTTSPQTPEGSTPTTGENLGAPQAQPSLVAPPSPPVRPSDAEIDALILPRTRDRLRTGSLFVLASMAAFTVLSYLFNEAPLVEQTLANLVRLAGLLLVWWSLRGEGSARNTLIWTSFGVAVLLLPGIELSRVRNDVVPMGFFTVSMACFAAIHVPWGARAQAALVAACLLAMGTAWFLIDHSTAPPVSSDTALAIANAMGVTILVAGVFRRWQLALRRRLAEARLADEELAAMQSELESRVAARTAQLEFANRELEGFSYTVSHDLRSPLRAIAGFSHLIQEESGDVLDDLTRDRLAKIKAATLRMDTLIDDMLVLARVSRSAVRTEAVDLAEVAREIVADLRSEHPDRQVEVRIAAIPLVTGDRGLLRIALDNLLRNAWKFTAKCDPARIEVFGGRVGPTVSCHVSDNGIGFDMQFRAKLFRPFERIHDEKDVDGTGIGLATVARIIDRLGGEVEADGRVGEGATFTFKLPAAAFTPKS